jgi:hypothetical protein
MELRKIRPKIVRLKEIIGASQIGPISQNDFNFLPPKLKPKYTAIDKAETSDYHPMGGPFTIPARTVYRLTGGRNSRKKRKARSKKTRSKKTRSKKTRSKRR